MGKSLVNLFFLIFYLSFFFNCTSFTCMLFIFNQKLSKCTASISGDRLYMNEENKPLTIENEGYLLVAAYTIRFNNNNQDPFADLFSVDFNTCLP